MIREIPYEENAICQGCGKKGAHDYYGDFFCLACAFPIE